LAIGSCHYRVPGIVDEISCLGKVREWSDVIRTVPLAKGEPELVIHKYLSNTIQDATWALAGVGQEWYSERVGRTLFGCIDLIGSGYIPQYHGH